MLNVHGAAKVPARRASSKPLKPKTTSSPHVRSADTKEAIAAFFEKRPPDFTKTAKVAVAQETQR